MNIEIMAVGTEVVRGEVLNSNAYFIAQGCAECGSAVVFHSAVVDDDAAIKEALRCAFTRADCVITTGGLGPTFDDCTKESSASFLELPCVLHASSLDYIRKRFSEAKREMPLMNEKQAYFPMDAQILPNPNGTAPGCIMKNKGKTIINLPGPPGEMIPMFNDYVKPYLRLQTVEAYMCRFLHIAGIGESALAEKLSDYMTNKNPSVAPYAKEGEVSLRLMASAPTKDVALSLIESVEKKIRQRIGDKYIYGTDSDTLESVIVDMLQKKKLTISIAESCTGGLCSARLVNVPGVSSVLQEGIVCYSNESKTARLGVSADTIERFGAVSKQTAEEMALGVAQTSNTDIGVGITGVAGPGQSDDKPAGLVYIAVAIHGIVQSQEIIIRGSRNKVRNATVTRTLDYIRRQIHETFL